MPGTAGTQDSYRADRRRARACGAWPVLRQSWIFTMASTRCSSTGTSEAASKGTMGSTLSSGSYGQTQPWEQSGRDKNAVLTRVQFSNRLPGHTAEAVLPGLATGPPAPRGCVRKQHPGPEPSFSFFSSFFCSVGKALYGRGSRATKSLSSSVSAV